jgi:hypothetical protein
LFFFALTQKEPKKSRLIFFFTLLKLKNGYQNALVYLSSVGKLQHHFVNTHVIRFLH